PHQILFHFGRLIAVALKVLHRRVGAGSSRGWRQNLSRSLGRGGETPRTRQPQPFPPDVAELPPPPAPQSKTPPGRAPQTLLWATSAKLVASRSKCLGSVFQGASFRLPPNASRAR